MSVLRQLPVVGVDVPWSKLRQIVDSCSQPYCSSYVRGPGFKLVRRVSPCRLVQVNLSDHLAPSMVRRHCLEQRFLRVQNSNPGWPAHFVAGECEKIAVQVLDIDRHVRD